MSRSPEIMPQSSTHPCELSLRSITRDGRLLATRSPHGRGKVELFGLVQWRYLGRWACGPGIITFAAGEDELFIATDRSVKLLHRKHTTPIWDFQLPED